MPKILIHSEEDEFLFAFLKALEKENFKLNISHILSETEDVTYLKSKYPNIDVISRYNTSRGIIPKLNIQALDKVDLEKYSKIEQMFNRFLDFKDPDMNFYGHERRSIYYDLLNFMIWILDEAKPDFVFFTNIPHQLHDSILAMLCEIKKIPFLIVRETNLPGIFYFDDTYIQPTKVLNKFKTKEPEQIKKMNKILKTYISICRESNKESLFKIYSKWRDHSIPFGYISNLRIEFLSKFLFYAYQIFIFVKKFTRAILKNIYYFLKKPKLNKIFKAIQMEDFFKSKNKSYQKSTTHEYYFEFFFFKNILKKFILYRNYKKEQNSLLSGDKYIYFPLHYQPEATTYPYGDVFIDQILAIKLLSVSLPGNIKIIIKEHPDTFNISRIAYIKGSFSRSFDYYEQISKLKNTQIVPMNTDTFNLIDNSIAVATLTGGTGMEAILRDKPTMIFGNAWYRDCHGVFNCMSKKSCADSVKEILNNFSIDRKQVEFFFSEIEKIVFPSSRTGAEPHLKFTTSKTHLTQDRYGNREEEFRLVAKFFMGSFKKNFNKSS